MPTTTVLTKSFFNPGRGGHAPGDLRDAFAEAIEAFESWNDGEPEPAVNLRERTVPISVICGYLWNCGDILPGDMVDALNDLVRWPEDKLRRGTYGAGARLLKSQIESVTK